MPVFAPIKQGKEQPKIHYSQHLKSEDTPEEAATKPAEPANPEAK